MNVPLSSYRVGFGFDVHPFEENRPLFLGGIRIPSPIGLAGHSDADVLLHALADAIFGAIGSTDIGQHFPNTDPRWRGCASSVFVCEAIEEVRQKGYVVVNVDCTILAEQPKISPHTTAIRQNLASLLGISLEATSLKATTTERLGFIGRGEGIAAMVVALVAKV
ncbi:MAG: 2-C-methyl-D-erythritol 2,4-cyclodiphosphate synthase [Candidatus Sumerlaeaceae bacterium]|nr:2-C-methyl-D-erythritol 2,4-cyclodiphosphate synthase [Candidatus Sumerlaeaceae bacterium]